MADWVRGMLIAGALAAVCALFAAAADNGTAWGAALFAAVIAAAYPLAAGWRRIRRRA